MSRACIEAFKRRQRSNMPKNPGDDEDSWPQPPTTRGAGFATVDLMLEAADERELFDRAAVLPQLTRSYDEGYGHFRGCLTSQA